MFVGTAAAHLRRLVRAADRLPRHAGGGKRHGLRQFDRGGDRRVPPRAPRLRDGGHGHGGLRRPSHGPAHRRRHRRQHRMARPLRGRRLLRGRQPLPRCLAATAGGVEGRRVRPASTGKDLSSTAWRSRPSCWELHGCRWSGASCSPLVGIVGLAGFAWWESRAESPVFDVKLFRHNRLFALSNLTALISYASAWAMTFLMSLYLQYITGPRSRRPPDCCSSPASPCRPRVSPFGGRLADRVQPRWVVSGGMGLCALGLASFTLLGFSYARIGRS